MYILCESISLLLIFLFEIFMVEVPLVEENSCSSHGFQNSLIVSVLEKPQVLFQHSCYNQLLQFSLTIISCTVMIDFAYLNQVKGLSLASISMFLGFPR